MHNCVTSHLWLKSALHASSHPCMCTCVLRLGCFLLACPVFYFVPPFSFQPFLMFTSEFNERSRSNPLCDFRLGTVATSDHETPLTGSKRGPREKFPPSRTKGRQPPAADHSNHRTLTRLDFRGYCIVSARLAETALLAWRRPLRDDPWSRQRCTGPSLVHPNIPVMKWLCGTSFCHRSLCPEVHEYGFSLTPSRQLYTPHTPTPIQGGTYRNRKWISSSSACGDNVPEGPPLCISAKSHMNNVFNHVPNDPTCDVHKRTKATRASCRRTPKAETIEYLVWEMRDTFTAVCKVVRKENESRLQHRYTVVVQDQSTH